MSVLFSYSTLTSFHSIARIFRSFSLCFFLSFFLSFFLYFLSSSSSSSFLPSFHHCLNNKPHPVHFFLLLLWHTCYLLHHLIQETRVPYSLFSPLLVFLLLHNHNEHTNHKARQICLHTLPILVIFVRDFLVLRVRPHITPWAPAAHRQLAQVQIGPVLCLGAQQGIF